MISFRVVTNLDEAEKLWRQFSFNQTLFDTWEFRYCFYKYFNYPIKFIVGVNEQGEDIGLLPLQQNIEKSYLEFFGGSWMEDNKVYTSNEHLADIPLYFQQINEPAHLIGINGQDEFSKGLPLDDYKYVLDLTHYSSYWDYITEKFNKKSQQTFKRKFKKIEELNPVIILNQDHDLDKLIEFNLKTFGQDSSFHAPFRKEIYRDFLSLPFNKHMLSFRINEEIQAVCLNIEYRGTLFYLNAGANNTDIPNLGSYAIMKAIEHGINNKLQLFDALMISYNWKERWHFDKIPFTKFNFQFQEAAIS